MGSSVTAVAVSLYLPAGRRVSRHSLILARSSVNEDEIKQATYQKTVISG